MNGVYGQLKTLIAVSGLSVSCQLAQKRNPSGLMSAWIDLSSGDDLPRFASALRAIGGRFATATVYRPDAIGTPDIHEVAYHFVLEGVPITVKTTVHTGESLSSLASIFPNADWEEREIMELGAIKIDDHPNPRRMFLDESIEAGVFDRYVPFSEFTNTANHAAVWARIREHSSRNLKREQAAEQAQEKKAL